MARLDVSLGTYQSLDSTSVVIPAGEKTLPQGTPTTVGWYTVDRGDILATLTSATSTVKPTLRSGYSLPQNNDIVVFTGLPGGSGLTFLTVSYYVVNSNSAAGTFQVSLTQGGTPVTLTANGAASYISVFNQSGFAGATHTAYLQPQRFGEVWTVERVTTQAIYTSSSGQRVTLGGVLMPTISIYHGIISASTLIDQTQNGMQDTDDLSSPLTLTNGQNIIIQWQNVQVTVNPANTRCWVWLGGETNR